MNDPTPTLIPLGGQHLKPVSRRPLNPQSPTRHRPSDNLLARLTPASALAALQSPTGPLKTCLDGASLSEKEFVVRTAIASQSIWGWLDELSEWPWPTAGGPAGFLPPSNHDTEHLGSLTAVAVETYERRIDQIAQDMEDLNIEEIKAHVLHNHIMPLSRPGTPMSESNRSTSSYSAYYNHMDDITAVVTAIVVQALPNLSKLSRLLSIWSTRLAVLRRIPFFLSAIAEAEASLEAGWNATLPSPAAGALGVSTHGIGDSSTLSAGPGATALSRNEFEIMRLVMEKKVTGPGKTLDYMLDNLEGLQDTLPDSWLDRMETVERSYGEWFATCEAKIREAEWLHAAQERKASLPKPEQHAQTSSDTQVTTSAGVSREDNGEGHVLVGGALGAIPTIVTTTAPANDAVVPPPMADPLAPHNHGLVSFEVTPPSSMLREAAGEVELHSHQLGTVDLAAPTDFLEPALPTSMFLSEETSSTFITPDYAAASISESSTLRDEAGVAGVTHESPPPPTKQATPLGNPDSPLFLGLPGEDDIEGADTSALSVDYLVEATPSRPPTKPRASSATFSSSTMVSYVGVQLDDSPSRPTTPNEDSFIEDIDLSPTSSISSPSKRPALDDQLRQQISEILEGIPANIKLSSEPSTINLNPPDLNLPRMPKSMARDPVRRSATSLSSRASTPSFTLAPAAHARSARPRVLRGGQQDIKVYHLSRSSGEAPIKLFIRLVGENGERVMVRVGGGWADLGEYLKEYASHHGRRSGGTAPDKVEVRDVLPRISGRRGAPTSTPPSRPASALDYSPVTPLNVQKTRKSFGVTDDLPHPPLPSAPRPLPRTPVQVTGTPPGAPTATVATAAATGNTPSSGASTRSRSSSRLSWGEEDSPMLGLAGPISKPVEMSEERRQWVESVKEKVRLASGERKVSSGNEGLDSRFGEIGRAGATKRLFRRG